MILKDKDHGSKTLEALGKEKRFKWGLQNNEHFLRMRKTEN